LTSQDVRDAISCIDPSKASGPDSISPKLIKEGKEELALALSNYFNKLLTKSKFPFPWKLANVCPNFNKSDPSNPAIIDQYHS